MIQRSSYRYKTTCQIIVFYTSQHTAKCMVASSRQKRWCQAGVRISRVQLLVLNFNTEFYLNTFSISRDRYNFQTSAFIMYNSKQLHFYDKQNMLYCFIVYIPPSYMFLFKLAIFRDIWSQMKTACTYININIYRRQICVTYRCKMWQSDGSKINLISPANWTYN